MPGRARSQRAEDDTRGHWLTTQPEDGRGYLVDEDVRRDLNCLDELYNGIRQMLMLEDVVDYGDARRARVSLGNAGHLLLHHGFGREAPGVAKLDKVVSGASNERNAASVVRLLAIGLLVAGTGGYNSLLVDNKGVRCRRHG